jgi:hypothetical protein
MDLKRLEAQGLIEKAAFSCGQIRANLNLVQHHLHIAQAPFYKSFWKNLNWQ